ncbi:hypothetical protein ACS0TY_017285 [Phlomoides rotata]
MEVQKWLHEQLEDALITEAPQSTLLELAPWKKRKELITGVLPIAFVEGRKKKRWRWSIWSEENVSMTRKL